MDLQATAIRFLSSLPAFKDVGIVPVRAVASHCRPLSVRSSESIFTEGDACDSVFILIDGRVKCYRTSPDGRVQIMKIFERAGDIFCATSAFTTGSYIVSAEAMTDASLYVVDAATMKRLSLEQPTVALALVTAAGDQMQSLVGLADDLALKTATTRVAKILLERAHARGHAVGTEIRLRRDDFREDEIASMVGAVRVHVSRSLKALTDMNAIALERDMIRISDVKILERFLDTASADRD
ncbi:MAG: Crp/Fnr family transcriptional regulator [Acidobacteria bacterium]|nr:Crp/Fnr family transcriptional regulator [Acidobacteriota bacterium]